MLLLWSLLPHNSLLVPALDYPLDVGHLCISQVQAVLRLVVSTDAGVVSDVSNWARMQNGLVVYLSR
jgi:hypothetical protein